MDAAYPYKQWPKSRQRANLNEAAKFPRVDGERTIILGHDDTPLMEDGWNVVLLLVVASSSSVMR